MKLVLIRWRDHCDHEKQWASAREARRFKPRVFTSIGWIVHEDEERLILTATHDEEHDQYHTLNLVLRSALIGEPVELSVPGTKV